MRTLPIWRSTQRVCAMLAGAGLMVCAGLVRAAESGGNAQVPALHVEPLAGGSLTKLGLGLFVVVLMIVGLSWIMKRMGGLPGAASGSLRILGGLSVGTRERVVLIQVGETQMLLGVAPGRVQALHVLDQSVPTNDPAKPGKGNFAASLNAALQRGNKS